MAATFFGHPRGLATLFLTEMWERFTFYGMRAVLILFLVASVATGGFGLDDKTAAAIYGLYNGAVYLAALPGGWVADRLIGAQRAVMLGGVLITAGNLLLAISTSPKGFYIGLLVIVLGVGLLKPNVSAIVAGLVSGGRRAPRFGVYDLLHRHQYRRRSGPVGHSDRAEYLRPACGIRRRRIFHDHRRGAVLFDPKVSGRGRRARLHRARRSAAIPAPCRAPRNGCDCGLAWRALALVVLGSQPRVDSDECVAAWATPPPTSSPAWESCISIYYFLFADLTTEERRRGVVLAVLFVGCALFFSGFEQAGSSLNLFADRYTDRMIGWLHFEIPDRLVSVAEFHFHRFVRAVFCLAVDRVGAAQAESFRAGQSSRSA